MKLIKKLIDGTFIYWWIAGVFCAWIISIWMGIPLIAIGLVSAIYSILKK